MRRAAFLLGFLLLASSAAAQFNTIWGVTTGQFNLWGLSIPQPTVNGTVLTYNLGTLSWAAGGGGSAFVTPTTIVIPNSTAQTDLLINPAVKTSGNLIDAQVGGVSKFSVTSAGVTSIDHDSTYQVGLTSMNTAGVWARHNSASLIVTDSNVDSGTSGISQVKKQIGGQSDWQLGWEATTTGNVTTDTFDTGLARASAGVVKVTNGSTGFGSLTTGSVTSSSSSITAGSLATAPTLNGEVRNGEYRVSWTNADVVALGSNLTGSIVVATLPVDTVVKNAYVMIGTAATNVVSLTVSVGRTAAAYVDYIKASNAMAAANTVYGAVVGDRGTNLTGYDLPSHTGTTAVYVQFICNANLSTVLTSTGTIVLETTRL